MEIKLDEITPETLEAVAKEWEESKLSSLFKVNVISLADELGAAKMHANYLLAKCRMRAIRMHDMGYDKADIAELFNVEVAEMTRWLRSDADVTRMPVFE